MVSVMLHNAVHLLSYNTECSFKVGVLWPLSLQRKTTYCLSERTYFYSFLLLSVSWQRHFKEKYCSGVISNF